MLLLLLFVVVYFHVISASTIDFSTSSPFIHFVHCPWRFYSSSFYLAYSDTHLQSSNSMDSIQPRTNKSIVHTPCSGFFSSFLPFFCHSVVICHMTGKNLCFRHHAETWLFWILCMCTCACVCQSLIPSINEINENAA